MKVICDLMNGVISNEVACLLAWVARSQYFSRQISMRH